MFLNSYRRAFDVLKQKPLALWGISLLDVLILAVASPLLGAIPILVLAAQYLIGCGMTRVYLDGLQAKEVRVEQLFGCFNKDFWRILGGMGWRDLWLLIWGLVPIAGPIIAIVKSYSYRFVPYILVTRPEVGVMEALDLSKEETMGLKMEMFLADLCFVGGVALALLILAIFGLIPILGIPFRLAFLLLVLAWLVFGTVFAGLYRAYFYENRIPTAPYEMPME